jgi:cell shape-determining protein MreD
MSERRARWTAAVKYLAYVPALLTVYILQSMVFPHIQLWGVKPLPLPLLVAAVAVTEGGIHGTAFGLAAGILCDMSLNQPAIEFTLTLTLLGFFVGLLSDTVLARTFFIFLLCALVSSFFCAAVQMLKLWLFYGAVLGEMTGTLLRQTGYSMLFAPLVYYLIASTNRLLRT